ncbi:MAG: hypothetical protein JXA69_16690 [Phycisphaerae bacterium]|nr:hypothetical protein [Phycisphaerae bacterium]
MTTKPADCSLPIGASGVPYDVRCPQCRYNLRGLTVPRCPECGLTFAWDDLERFRVPPESSLVVLLRGAGMCFVALSVAFVLMVTGAPLLVVALAVAAILAVAALQACVEFIVVLVWVGPLYWPRFRTWWEGVLLGYGVTVMTWLMFGYEIIPFERPFRGGPPADLWCILLLTTVEAIGIQWFVVRRQLRIRNQIPVPPRGLWWACLLAKLVSALLWLAVPVTFVRF